MRTFPYRPGVHQHSSVGTEGRPISCQRLLSDPIPMRLYIEQLVRKIWCTGLSPLGLASIHLQFELGGPTRCPTGTTLILFALWSNSRSFFFHGTRSYRRGNSSKDADSPGVLLLEGSSALRTYRNRQLGPQMRCCEAWALVCRCFDPMSLQCTDNNALTGVITSLARANIDQRGNQVGNLPLAQEEKTKSSQRTTEVAELGPVSNLSSPCSQSLTRKVFASWTPMMQIPDSAGTGLKSLQLVRTPCRQHFARFIHVRRAPAHLR